MRPALCDRAPMGYLRLVASVASLVEPFLAGADDALRSALAAVSNLDVRLDELVAAARAEWPGVAVPADVYVGYVAERLAEDRDPSEVLSQLRAGDLYLACACARGDAAAIAAFDGRFMNDLTGALARMRLSSSQLDEVKQLVRHRLFVADPGARPKIAEYSGRSGLRRWLRSVAVRTCLNFMRKGKREVLIEDEHVLVGVSAAGDDPEIAYMKEKYRSEFRAAFLDSLAQVSPRQQSLLRYHYVDNLNIDEIGTIYRVHRVTAYRWLEKARDALVQKTGEILRERLAVDGPEYESILRLIQSQLHISLVRYLGEREPE